MLEKKKILKVLIIILIMVFIMIIAKKLIKDTNAKYATSAETNKDVDVAFVITDSDIKTGNILLEDIYPSDKPYKYRFSVSNNDGNKRAETIMDYTIKLVATTNVPLEYEIYRNTTKCEKKESIIKDKDETQYKQILVEPEGNNLTLDFNQNQTDYIDLEVTFPMELKDNYKYADSILNLRVEIEAKQRIEGETLEKPEPKK